jgi:hypothetical protein
MGDLPLVKLSVAPVRNITGIALGSDSLPCIPNEDVTEVACFEERCSMILEQLQNFQKDSAPALTSGQLQ